MNNQNHLIFDGCDMVELAEQFGTPLYVISESYIKERCLEIRRDFLERYPNTRAVYASKAFQTLDMCRLIDREGLGFDVVSGGELYTALKAGVHGQKIIFHGNNKSPEECRMALAAGVGLVVVDNGDEFELWEELTGELGQTVDILFRLAPGVHGHTHQYISTGHQESKFGFSPDALIKEGWIRRALNSATVRLLGFHFHIGSQLLDNRDHIKGVELLLPFLKEVQREYGYVPTELNLGGGFGIQYEGDPPRKPLAHFTDPMMERLERYYQEEGLERPRVTIEPGRFIVGEAGITLYHAGFAKKTPGGRSYMGIDGGFPDNPRTALYQAKYDVVAAERVDEAATELVTLAGKCCESGDILVWDAKLPTLTRGELLAVRCTGAYTYSMSSNYNRIPRPALVMVQDGKARLSVRRETYEDLIQKEG